MKEYKKAFRYAAFTVNREKYNSGLYLVLFLAGALAVYVYRGYGAWLWEAGESVNLWEPFLWFQSGRSCQIAFLFVSVYLGYQTINGTYNECYTIVRMSRSSWAASRMLHLIWMVLVCNAVLLMSTWLGCAGRISIRNEWSSSSMTAAQFGMQAVGAVPLMEADIGVMEQSPWLVGLWAFGLSSLAGVFTGFLLMVFTAARQFAWGMALFGMSGFLLIRNQCLRRCGGSLPMIWFGRRRHHWDTEVCRFCTPLCF